MAGRILPIALAVVSGVSIGIATFDGEFKAQRKRRLEEEYKQEVGVASALNHEIPSPIVPNAPSLPAQQVPSNQKSTSSASWSYLLGGWAWKGNGSGEDTLGSTSVEQKPSHIPPAQEKGQT